MAKDEKIPRWDVVNTLYDVLDEGINKLYTDKSITYAEIEFAMIMMNEKLLQQKIHLMHSYLHSENEETVNSKEDNVEPKPEPKDLYK
tara:strand:- start:371 stop:634 length:264 start_codon:yes stop_codon:yes gene_type:complete